VCIVRTVYITAFDYRAWRTSSSALRPLPEPQSTRQLPVLLDSPTPTPSPRIRLRPYFFSLFFSSIIFFVDGSKFVALMALVERHLRSHFSPKPYKYTPVSARLGRPPLRVRTPLLTRSSSSVSDPSSVPLLLLPPSPSSPTGTAHPGMATAASANAPGNNHRSIAQKRPRAQTLVLSMPTRPPPPSAPTTPHPSHYSHSHAPPPPPPHPQPYHPHPHQLQASTSTTTTPSAASPHVSEILPRLYISDLQTAEDPAALAALGITHVLSAMPGRVAMSPALAAHAMQIPLHDAPFAELAAHLPRTTRYIARALRASPDARVLVHCAMGASRSVAVVCGYLIAAHGLHPAQALEFVRARRAAAAPNRGFVDQLHEYHRSLGQGQAALE
jgi:atypical dual specificity phosphatase